MLEPEDTSVLWLLVVGFIIAFILAFGIGANDVANSFGTSVGAKVLTLFQACIIACIFEMAGCILIGSKVSNTVRKGIIDIELFNGTEEMAMVGSFSALSATSTWLILATFLNLPVSGTHSIVGAVIGYALVAFHGKGITWSTFGKIASSWIISPLFSGLVSSGIFLMIDRLILKKDDPLKYGLLALPFLSAATIFINIFSILYSNRDIFGMASLAWYSLLCICLALSALIGGTVHFAVNPWLEKKIVAKEEERYRKEAQTLKQVEKGETNLNYPTETPVLIRNTERNAHIEETSSISTTSHYTISGLEIDRKKLIRFDSGRKSRRSLPKPNEPSPTIPPRPVVTDKPVQPNTEEVDYKRGPLRSSRRSRGGSTWSLKSVSTTVRSRAESFGESVRSRGESFMLQGITKSIENIDERSKIQDDPKAGELFKYLQILTASFGAFAHGGNDVSNAIGPAISLWIVYKYGTVASSAPTPIWILLYGGVGIIVGLCVWGRRVIKTIGENLSPITPSSGFSIEIGSALTVLLASNLGIPISTTHCKVGSVVMVGRLRSKEVVDWSLFGSIALSWIVTMPITGGISAGMYAFLRAVL